MRNYLRSPETEEKYLRFRSSLPVEHACLLCKKEPIKSYDKWIIIKNDFPYDKIATLHHMIMPKRHTTEPDLTKEERDEFIKIKRKELQSYDIILESTENSSSIRDHYHIHLLDIGN